MINAKEAYLQSANFENSVVTQQLKIIENCIKNAIENGQFAIRTDYNVNPRVLQELKKAGYKVIDFGGRTEINWSNEPEPVE